MKTRTFRLFLLPSLTALAFSVSQLSATLVLQDLNSTVEIDTSTGVTSWVVDGQNQLMNQWFWYRAGGDTQESSIDMIGGLFAGTSDPDFNGDDNAAFIRYENSDFKVEVTYNLFGGTLGSGTSDLAEQIRITNTSGADLNFTFFQYSDFELGAFASDDSVVIGAGGQIITQTDPFLSMSETVTAPVPTLVEANVGSATIDALNDANLDDLNGVTASGPDDVTWALQWNFVISDGDSVLISKDKQLTLVPEPGTFALFLGLASFGWMALRRRTSK